MKQKQTLQQNVLTKSKQLFRVSGLPEVVILERASLDVAVGAIELPDGTKVSGGRVEPGEFTVTLHMSDELSLEAYLDWFEQSVDAGTYAAGVHPNYKRNAEIEFQRLFVGQPASFSSSGDDLGKIFADIEGVWCSKYVIPEGNIDENDGDASLKMECTLNYDDVRIHPVARRTSAESRGASTGNAFANDTSDQWKTTARPNLV
jgi:hypothetical protein